MLSIIKRSIDKSSNNSNLELCGKNIFGKLQCETFAQAERGTKKQRGSY
jgi:hypothetical protein